MRAHLLQIILILLISDGCNKIQHPEEISIGKIENYDQLLSATAGVYGKLARAFTWENIHGGSGMYAVNVKGDDLNFGYPEYGKLYGLGCWEPYIRDNYVEIIPTAWKLLYQVIVSANNILVQYEDVDQYDARTRNLLGEIYLIRAYCYFRLTRTYGQIPLIGDIDIKYNITLPTFETIYAFIENDLKTAMSLLPENNASARIPYVTPHRGTAKAILAEVYLSWAGYPVKDNSKYARAAKEAGEVIDSADFFGFGLMDDFAWVWDKRHYYNKESIFTLYYADPSSTASSDKINTLYQGRAYSDEIPNYVRFSPQSPSLNILFFPAEIQFFNNYPSEYRKDITFFSTIYVPNDFPYYPQIDTGYVHIDSVDNCSRIAYRKFFLDSVEIPDVYVNQDGYKVYRYYGNPKIYLFRYAQTVLTYAEAAARLGQLDAKAYECVNEIRRRSRHLDLHSLSVYDLEPGLSPDAFADSVVQERAWELAGEPEGRWFDLVRLEKVEELPKLTDLNEFNVVNFPATKENYFYPPPPEDVIVNPNLGD